MIGTRQTTGWLSSAALLPLLALAMPASAQETSLPSVSEYRLPTPSDSPSVRPQGPTDRENPVVRPAPSRPVDEAKAEPKPARETAPPPREPEAAASEGPAEASPVAAPSAAASQAAKRSMAGGTPSPTVSPATTASTQPQVSRSPESAGSAVPTVAPSPVAVDVAAPVPSEVPGELRWRVHSANDTRRSSAWPWVALVAFLLGIAATVFGQRWFRSRQADRETAYAEPYAAAPAPLVPQPAPDPVAEPAIVPAPDPVAATPAEPVSVTPIESVSPAIPVSEPASATSRPALDLHVNPLDVQLTAQRLSATLLNTTLFYELVVANQGEQAIGPITVGGDMIAAHASLPTRQQLELTGSAIEVLHRLQGLEPGESRTFKGEFRLPLASITPIRNGSAALFVPLARFRVEAMRKGAPPLVIDRTFVVGETPDVPDAALKPFRLDLGPRNYSRLGQREVAMRA